jgi:hypothetical protein
MHLFLKAAASAGLSILFNVSDEYYKVFIGNCCLLSFIINCKEIEFVLLYFDTSNNSCTAAFTRIFTFDGQPDFITIFT